MVKDSIEVKVCFFSNISFDKVSFFGVVCLYVSKDLLIFLMGGFDGNWLCFIECIESEVFKDVGVDGVVVLLLRREVLLWVLLG